MKTLIKFLAVILAILISSTVRPQVKINSDLAITNISGCYYTGNDAHGLLMLHPDRTFEWKREKPGNGTWKMKKVLGIPFPAEIIILKYATGKKEKFQVFSDIGAIDIGRKPYMRRIPCK